MSAARPLRGLFPGLWIVFLVGCAVFAPAVTYGFAYDDSWTIQTNHALDSALGPLVKQLLLGRAAAAHIPDATRPVMVVSLWVDRRLFGADPSGYHLHSLLLYGLATAAAALAVFALVRSRAAALAGGIFFAAAPVHAEVAAAINYREDLYAGIAVMGAIALLFWPRRGKLGKLETAGFALLLAVGLLGKESTIVTWLLVPTLAAIKGAKGPCVRQRAALLGAGLGTSLVWALFRGWLRISGRDDVPLTREPRGAVDRLLRTARYVTETTADGLLPLRWAPDYAPRGPASPVWLLGACTIVVLVVWLAKHRFRALACGIATAALAGLATSPLVSPINERADRYAFVAVLGGSILWGSLFTKIPRARRLVRRAVLWGAALVLSLIARSAAAPWQSDLSLWTTAVQRAPSSARAFTGLSRALRLRGDLDGAERTVAHAVELDPAFLRARVNVVYNALARGDVEAAARAIREVDVRGGSTQLGMNRARRCVTLPPEEAIRCSGFSPRASGQSPPVESAP